MSNAILSIQSDDEGHQYSQEIVRLVATIIPDIVKLDEIREKLIKIKDKKEKEGEEHEGEEGEEYKGEENEGEDNEEDNAVQVQLFLCALYHRYLDSDALRLLVATVTM